MRYITFQKLSIYQNGMKEKIIVLFRFYFFSLYMLMNCSHMQQFIFNLHNDRTQETSCQHTFVEIHMHYFCSNDVSYLHVVTSFSYLSQTYCI